MGVTNGAAMEARSVGGATHCDAKRGVAHGEKSVEPILADAGTGSW